jgi:hypothetical protein
MKKQPIVFDIDGTLTSEPYDEPRLGSLRANSAMMLVALALQLERPLIIATARSESHREVTEKWLANHGLNPTKIYMRPESKEGVPPSFIKENYLRDIRKKFGEPMVWADDNGPTVAMLRKNNVPVIHVNAEE